MKSAGFTLIEILIALFISTIIAVLTFSGLQALIHIQHSLSSTNKRYSQLQTAFWHLQQDTAQFQTANFVDSHNDRLPSFSLQPNEFSLITAQTPKFNVPWPSTGLLRIKYQLTNHTLYRISYPIENQAFSSFPFREPLISNVIKISFLALDKHNHWQTSLQILNTNINPQDLNSPKAIDVIVYFKHRQVHRLFPLVNPLINGGSHV